MKKHEHLTAQWYEDNGWCKLTDSQTYKQQMQGMSILGKVRLVPDLEHYSNVLIAAIDTENEYWLFKFFPAHVQEWAFRVETHQDTAHHFIADLLSNDFHALIKRYTPCHNSVTK
jgi:hypothetical protein